MSEYDNGYDPYNHIGKQYPACLFLESIQLVDGDKVELTGFTYSLPRTGQLLRSEHDGVIVRPAETVRVPAFDITPPARGISWDDPCWDDYDPQN